MPDDPFTSSEYLATIREGAEDDPRDDKMFRLMSDAVDQVCARWGWEWSPQRLDGATLAMCLIGNLVSSGIAPADAGAVIANWLAWVVEPRVDEHQ